MRHMIYPLALLSVAGAAFASSSVAYVAGTGADAVNCGSYTSPCRTFQGALTQLTLGGTIMALDSADFTLGNTMSFGYSLTIDGGAHGAFASGPAGGPAIYVSNGLGGAAVVIRNLTIVPNVSNNSIGIIANFVGGALKLEGVTVSIPDSALSTSGIAVSLDPTSSVSMKNLTVYGGSPNGSQIGIAIYPYYNSPTTPYHVNLDHVTCDGSNIAFQVVEGDAVIRDSSFRNSFVGIDFSSSLTSPNVIIEDSEISNNLLWGLQAVGGTARLSNSTIAGNGQGINVAGGATVISFRNNTFAGNISDGPTLLSTSLK
jgi:hypothetical protein